MSSAPHFHGGGACYCARGGDPAPIIDAEFEDVRESSSHREQEPTPSRVRVTVARAQRNNSRAESNEAVEILDAAHARVRTIATHGGRLIKGARGILDELRDVGFGKDRGPPLPR